MSTRRPRPALPADQLTIVWQSASLLLDYPDEHLLARAGLIRAASRGLPPQVGDPLRTFLDHLEALGVLDEVTFLLTADHGFEGADPSVTGSWTPALEALGIPYRDEGPGFVYLL